MTMVTVDECKQAVRDGDIKRTSHHRCGGCGYMTGYVFDTAGNVFIDPAKQGLTPDDLVVGYDAGCDCSSDGPGPVVLTTWDEFADSFNMEDSPEHRRTMFDRFRAKKPTHDAD